MRISGKLIALLTFPGVILHELAHQIFCRFTGVAIYDVCYYRFSEVSGYVTHEPPSRPLHTILISVGPFIINTIVGAVISLPASINLVGPAGWSDALILWLGISIAMHAIPSRGDAKNIWSLMKRSDVGILTKVITLPICTMIYIGSLGWINLFYGMAVTQCISYLLVKIVA